MLVEKKLNDALKDYIKGKKIVVLMQYDDGSFDTSLLSSFLEGENIHYLVDVPAVENPDFAQAVINMMTTNHIPERKSEEKPEEKSGGVVQKTIPEEAKEQKKSKREIVEELSRQGKSCKEICEITGFKNSVVSQYRYNLKKKEGLKEIVPAGHNADRHLCEKCRYRAGNDLKRSGAKCAYIDIVGHSRGCAAEDCDVYEKGNPPKDKSKITIK